MNYAGIKYCDIANGLGCRTVLFVSVAGMVRKGCFQPETWSFTYGKPFDEAVENEILESLKPDYIRGLTLLGGDPMEEENQKALLPFMRKVKRILRIRMCGHTPDIYMRRIFSKDRENIQNIRMSCCLQ